MELGQLALIPVVVEEQVVLEKQNLQLLLIQQVHYAVMQHQEIEFQFHFKRIQ